MRKSIYLFFIFSIALSYNSIAQQSESFSYLALGDSYTKGEGVCDTCSFPKQLTAAIEEGFNKKVKLNVIAETGWTTSNLKNTLEYADLGDNNDLVTLMIGVNNQYQGLSYSKFKREFPKIIDQAIAAAQGNPRKVIVLSIPDYAYTPSTYGADNQKKVTKDIDKYNEWISFITNKRGAYYFNITDLTRLGIADPTLVAKDGLHISKKAHERFANKMYPTARKILKYEN